METEPLRTTPRRQRVRCDRTRSTCEPSPLRCGPRSTCTTNPPDCPSTAGSARVASTSGTTGDQQRGIRPRSQPGQVCFELFDIRVPSAELLAETIRRHAAPLVVTENSVHPEVRDLQCRGRPNGDRVTVAVGLHGAPALGVQGASDIGTRKSLCPRVSPSRRQPATEKAPAPASGTIKDVSAASYGDPFRPSGHLTLGEPPQTAADVLSGLEDKPLRLLAEGSSGCPIARTEPGRPCPAANSAHRAAGAQCAGPLVLLCRSAPLRPAERKGPIAGPGEAPDQRRRQWRRVGTGQGVGPAFGFRIQDVTVHNELLQR